MKTIGLIDIDGKIPNLALMKISAWHKNKRDNVEWYEPFFTKPDIIYASKVFTYTTDYQYWPDCDIIKGGTGYNIKEKLPNEIEFMRPDYGLYSIDYGMGFLTRGCIRSCPWCIVTEKEGSIKPNQDFREFTNPKSKNLILLDNNVLASDYGIKQIEIIVNYDYKIDFNQGLDARLIDDSTAKILAKCRWLKPIRLACDTDDQMPIIEKAVNFLRKHGATPRNYSCYVLIKDIDSALIRVNFLRNINVDPFAQPYRDFNENKKPEKQLRDFARWVNHKAIFKSVSWENYKTDKRLH